MSDLSPEPRAWAVGASYWGARESVPYMLRDEAEPLYDAAALAAARRQALKDAARWLDEDLGHAVQAGYSVEAVQALIGARDLLRAHAEMVATTLTLPSGR